MELEKINDVCAYLLHTFWRGAVWMGTEEEEQEAKIGASFSVTGYFGSIK
jgi:hypothetical protein